LLFLGISDARDRTARMSSNEMYFTRAEALLPMIFISFQDEGTKAPKKDLSQDLMKKKFLAHCLPIILSI
jgi:hypothetical protein